MLNCFNQFTAIGPVNIFATTLLQVLKDATNGQFPVTPKIGAFIIGLVNLIFAALSVIPINYFGRRPLLIFGQVFMAISHLLIGIFYITEQYLALFIFILVFIMVF